MDGNPPRPPPPPPPQRSPPQSSPPKSRRPPLMQRNSTTGGLAPSQRYDNDTGLRTRTFSADVHEGVTANSNSVTARHHRHTRSKVRFESVDPLLRMSLERPDIEDEAETTLLDVLERRQSDPYSTVTPAHRRNRTYVGDIPNTFQSPNYSIDMTRPNSAPDSTDVMRNRPGLISSRRNSGNISNGATSNLNDYLGVNGDGVSLSPNDDITKPDTIKPAISDSDVSSSRPNSADAMHASPSRSKFGWNNNSFRHRPQFQFNRHRATSENAEYSENNNQIRAKAYQVAMTMRNDTSNLLTSTRTDTDGDLSDLIYRVEASREHDENSLGSASKTAGENFRASLNSNTSPRDSWSKSTKSQDGRTTHQYKKSHHQVFMGISNPLGDKSGGQSNIDMLFQAAENVRDLCQIPEEDEQEDYYSNYYDRYRRPSMKSQTLAKENADFLQAISESHPEVPEIPNDSVEQEPNEQTPMLDRLPGQSQVKANKTTNKPGKLKAVQAWVINFRRQLLLLGAAFDFGFVRNRLWKFIQYEVSCVIVPLLAVATFFFYRLGNPTFPFLPNETSASWWILFIIRSYLTLQLSYATQYIFVDVLATRSPVTVQMFGPLVTLYIMNSKGWPFILTCWGIWNYALVRGNSDFYEHWFYLTEIDMLNNENRADGIVDGEMYTDLLLSMILAGVATSIKRTILALYLGKRVYIHYKPKLEKVMVDMLLLVELAELANALEAVEGGEKMESPQEAALQVNSSQVLSNRSTMIEIVKGRQENAIEASDCEVVQEEVNLNRPEPVTSWNRLRSDSMSDDEVDNNASESAERVLAAQQSPIVRAKNSSIASDLELKTSIESGLSDIVEGSEITGLDIDEADTPNAKQYNDFFAESIAAPSPEISCEQSEPVPIDSVNEPVRHILHKDSTTFQIRQHLDRWQEPINKLDKEREPTIHEVLQFRKALSFLDDDYPFGLAFGPAFDRNSCIDSSRSLYKRLLAFDTNSPVLHFDVIGVLAYESDGEFDETKAKALVRLIRPDKHDAVTLLAFVQSCDYVYKRLRYLRASVGNSTSIDRVLENIFNAIFNFFLFLSVLSIMQLNPWALLVSLSTVMVSFAFALGPT